MIFSKKTLNNQGELNKSVIDWAIEVKSKLAILDRKLKIDTDKSNENNIFYIDDITPEEIQAGLDAVKEYCFKNNFKNLYYDYLLSIADTDEDKLNALKEKKKEELDNKRDNLLYNKPFFYNGNNFQVDQKSRDIISAYANSSLPTISLISLANDIVTFTNEEFKAFNNALLLYTNDTTIKARQLKNSVILAQSVDEVNNINWE